MARRFRGDPIYPNPDLHDAKVDRIARALRERRSSAPLSLNKRTVSHQVPKRYDRKYSDEKLDVSELDAILELDVESRRCVAEPGVTFARLLAATLPFGLAPQVVPELKTITVGGAVAGCSLESTSFRFGGFHDTCSEYEVITARGDVLRCTPENEHQLLFQMMHGSFGTLGVLSRLTFSLMPVRPFVHLTFEQHRNWEDYRAAIERHVQSGDVELMDGIIHASSACSLALGRFVDEAPYLHRYDWLKVYYTTTRVRSEDYLRTLDYYFRYDRGVTNVHPRSAVGRLLFGRWLGSDRLLRLAERFHRFLPADNPSVNVDVFVPASKTGEFLQWYEREIGFFPLWCVPYRRTRDYEWLSDWFHRQSADPLYIDLAIYGLRPKKGDHPQRRIEEELFAVGGLKTLISHNYYSEDEFWRIWNRANYQRVKAITDPDNLFRDLYDKTCRAPRGL
jgi:FAD/FMN-containing dehydrogenase